MQDELRIGEIREKKPTPRQGNSVETPPPEWDIRDPEPGAGQAPPPPPTASSEQPPPPPPLPLLPGMEEEEEETGPKIDIMRFVRGIWGRRRLIAAIASGITVLFGLLAFLFLHHTWKAEVALIHREHPDIFRVGQFSEPYKPQKYNLTTLVDGLKLPSVLQETIRRSGIDIKPVDFSKHIDVIVGKDSKMFRVSVEWESPEKAAEIANNLADVFVERNRKLRRAELIDVYKDYSTQLVDAKKKLQQANTKLLDLQKRLGITDLSKDLEIQTAELMRLRSQRQDLQAELSAAREALKRINDQIKVTPKMIVQSTYYRNPLKKNLADLEWQLEQARGKYTDKNPKIIDLKTRIAKIREMIKKGADKDSPENTYAFNPVLQELQLKRYALEDQIRTMEKKLSATDTAIADLSAHIASLTDKQKEYQAALQEKESAARLVENLMNRVEEAKVLAERAEGDFIIVERAIPPEEPESSGRKLVVILGAVLGMGVGLMVAVVLELRDPRLRTRKDVELLLDCEFVYEFERVPANEQIVVDQKYPAEPVAMIFRRFANELESRLKPEQWRSLAITSAERNCGRTLVAVNLAQILGQQEKNTILVDADLTKTAGERPESLYEVGVHSVGLMEILQENADAMQALIATETPGVRLLPACGHAGISDHAILSLGGRNLHAVKSRLEGYAQHVLYDLPPLSAHETVYEAAKAIGSVLLVIRSGQSKRQDVQKVQQRLQALGAEIVAVVITDVPYDLLQGESLFYGDETEE